MPLDLTTFVKLDFVSLAITYVLSFVVGMLIYGPVLGKPWSAAMKREKSDTKWAEKSLERKGMASLFVVQGALHLVQMVVLAWFLAACKADTPAEGAVVGFWVWFGLLMPYTVSHANWEDRPLTVTLISLLNDATILIFSGAIISHRHDFK